MRLSHRFKIASKKKKGRVIYRKRIRRIKMYWEVKNIASLMSMGVDHEGHSSPEICGLDLYPLLPGEVVLNTSEQEFLSLQSFLKPLPDPPAAPSPPKHERYISIGCVKDISNVSEPAKKTVTQKLAGFLSSLTNRVRGVFNA